MIICGDCLDVMKGMEPESVDAIVTDPPYGLEFMGKEWDKLDGVHIKDKRLVNEPSAVMGFQDGGGGNPFSRSRHRLGQGVGVSAPMQEWHRAWAVEALRVAKPGAHLLAFGGTRTFHRLTCAVEDAGWEIRDVIMYCYGSGFPKSHNLKGEHDGWGTALKPAWEPIIMARKPLRGTVAENVRKWGTGAINVDGCRVETTDKYSYPNGPGGCKASAFHYVGRADKPAESHPQGRWPANLIHDGSDEVVGLFPKNAHRGDGKNDSGSAARFFYCAKASRKEREAGLEGMPEKRTGMMQDDNYEWPGTPEHSPHRTPPAKNHHPTVKPLALMRYLCRLVTPPNGLILDPFAGSGTTGIAAKQDGFRFIGIEKNAEYCEIARKRIENASYQMELA